MNQKSYKNNKEFTIPLFLPLMIIILSIILFIKIFNSNATVIASTNKEEIDTSMESELEIVEVGEQEEEMLSNPPSEVIEEVEENTTNGTVQKEEVKTVTYTASNGKDYTTIAILNIPSLGIEYPILSETSTQLLKVSLTKYWGANPNEVGNMVVVGHNYKNNKFFGKLPNIKHGDIIKIKDFKGRTLEYKVYETSVIDPYDNSCTSQLTNGQTEITLITCYYENGSAHATKRFIVKARAY